VFHNLLQDLVLLVVKNTSVQILLKLLKKNGVFLACQQEKDRHLEKAHMSDDIRLRVPPPSIKYISVSKNMCRRQELTLRHQIGMKFCLVHFLYLPGKILIPT
jgi:hypothetical protein